MLVKKNIDQNNFQVSWLRFEQEIPFELEDSCYWLLSNLEIKRFSFEYYPPKTKLGQQNLYLKMDNMLKMEPLFVDVILSCKAPISVAKVG